ncbi:MAG: TonB-dependent receptor, partial [Cyclobacteriaceae bacterium]
DLQYLDEVIISAGKFSKKRSQNGRVVDVITHEEILRSGSRDIGQLLHGRTGLFVNGANSAPSKDRGIYMRGAGPQYSLIMIDGIPLYDPAGVNGVFDLRMLSLGNIERIEILKGSQSTLYGTDAMAGVINIITREGEEGLHPNAALSFGSYAQAVADVGITGKQGKVSYSAGYRFWHSSEISEARAPKGSGFDEDPFLQHAFNASASIALTSGISFSPFIQFSSMAGEYDAGAFTDAPDNKYEARNYRYGFNMQSAGKNPWQVQLAHNRLDRKFQSEFGDLNSVGSLWHGEVFYTHHIAEQWRALGGIMFQQQEITSESISDARILAPYLSLFYAPMPGIHLEGGLRLNHHSEFGNELTISVNPSWQLNKSWKIYANYTTGFKAPTLSQLYGQFGPNPNLRPETSR